MMTTNNGCSLTPQPGHEATSLFFTKAPGEDYYKVYARYQNDPAWVPIHIAQEAGPDLQQVRDKDRNISMNSGSYDDAHFYLRSADGNNMTAAFFSNVAGAGIQSGNADGFTPLNLQPEGGTLTYGGEEVATKEWVNGKDETDPVYTASLPNQVMYKGVIPSSVDLNSYTMTGKYYQNSNANAASGSNYPSAYAGMLEVTNGANDMIFQTYQTYWGGGNNYYQRSYYSGTWGQWIRRVAESEVQGIFRDAAYGYAGLNNNPMNSTTYNYPQESDNPAGDGVITLNFGPTTIGSGLGGVQFAVGYNSNDNFWFRPNYNTGNWATAWFHVASRAWVDTATIKNQNTSAQSADYWISGTARSGKLGVNTAPSASANFQVAGKTFLNGGLDVGDTAYYDNDVAFSVKSDKAHLFNMYDGSANPKLSLLQSGNLGVGVISPTEKLDVNGSVKQSAVTSSMLKADADGKIVAADPGTDYMLAADLASGSYTPTFSNLKGSVSSVSGSAMYSRAGDIVTVSGMANVTLAASGAAPASFELTLPIPADPTISGNCSGVGTGPANALSGVNVQGNATLDKALVNFERTSLTGTTLMNFMFMYKAS